MKGRSMTTDQACAWANREINLLWFQRYYDLDTYDAMLEKLRDFANGTATRPEEDSRTAEYVRKVTGDIRTHMNDFIEEKEFWEKHFMEVRTRKAMLALQKLLDEKTDNAAFGRAASSLWGKRNEDYELERRLGHTGEES